MSLIPSADSLYSPNSIYSPYPQNFHEPQTPTNSQDQVQFDPPNTQDTQDSENSKNSPPKNSFQAISTLDAYKYLFKISHSENNSDDQLSSKTGKTDKICEIDTTINESETPLHKATLAGDFAEIRRLVEEEEADLYAATSEGETPMTYAIKQDRLDIVYFFVSSLQYDINHLQNPTLRTPLEDVCQIVNSTKFHTQKTFEIAKYLIKEGALITPRLIFEVKRLPTSKKYEIKCALVPCNKIIHFLISAGASISEISKLVKAQIKEYVDCEQMTAPISTIFVNTMRIFWNAGFRLYSNN